MLVDARGMMLVEVARPLKPIVSGFESWVGPLFAVYDCVKMTAQSLSFPICEMEITVPALTRWHEAQTSQCVPSAGAQGPHSGSAWYLREPVIRKVIP